MVNYVDIFIDVAALGNRLNNNEDMTQVKKRGAKLPYIVMRAHFNHT